jgi:glycosyltransferase involved in cell wall biosynthesis
MASLGGEKRIRISKNYFTLVIVCRNHKQFLNQARKSLSRQSLKPRQLILVDVASRDQSDSALERWARAYGSGAKVIYLEEPTSIVEVFQLVEPLISEPLVSFLSADDFSNASRFETQVDALSDAPDSVGVCFSDAIAVDAKGQSLNTMRSYSDASSPRILPASKMLDMLLEGNRVIAPSVMMRTEPAKKAIMSLNASMPFEDYPLWLELAKTCDFLYLPQPLVSYRFHSDNASRKFLTKLRFIKYEIALVSSIFRDNPEKALHTGIGASNLLRRSVKLGYPRGAWGSLVLLVRTVLRSYSPSRWKFARSDALDKKSMGN